MTRELDWNAEPRDFLVRLICIGAGWLDNDSRAFSVADGLIAFFREKEREMIAWEIEGIDLDIAPFKDLKLKGDLRKIAKWLRDGGRP